MQVISFMNMKGGVGKTTLAVNVAFTLAQVHHKKVLFVDCDPQFNASQYLLSDDAYLAHISNHAKGTIKDIFLPKSPGPVNTLSGVARPIDRSNLRLADCTANPKLGISGRGKFDLIPSTLALIEVQNSPRQTEAKLKRFLHEKANGYDYVIIDCPPTISIFTEAAILASDKYIVPIKPDPLSIVGLPLLERYIENYTNDVGMTIEQIGLVFTQVRGPIPHMMRDLMNDLRRERAGAVFKEHLSQSTHVAESVDAHQPLLNYRKATNKVVMQIVDITAEFLNRTGG